jgi:hypothetical protein
MTDEPYTSLNGLLRRWAAEQMRDDAAAQRLRARVVDAIGAEAFLDVTPAPPARRRAGVRGALWFAAGAAAAVLAACIFWLAGPRHEQVVVDEHPADRVPAVVHFLDSQLAEKARLLAGMEELFNGRLAWVAEVGRQVQVALLPDGAPISRDARPLAVRVVVLQRTAGAPEWHTVWGADLLTRDEQFVELGPREARGARLRLWTQRLPDGAIAFDADLALRGDSPVRSSFRGIQHGRIPQRVFSVQTDDAEYRVYQTVALLRNT